MDWYTLNDADAIDSPALLVYKDRAFNNIRTALTMLGEPAQLRPHVKTHKMTEVCRMMLEAGINKFKAATIAEAEMLGVAGAADVILAYQPNKPKFRRLLKLISEYPQTAYSCLVDNLSSAQMFSEMVLEAGRGKELSIFIDLNVGMNRTGIRPEKAFKLLQSIQDLPGLRFSGFHAYDGHIRNIDFEARKAHCEQEFKEVEQLRVRVQAESGELPLLVAGGSPTFTIHSSRDHAECCPGTFVFWDKGYHDTLPEQHFDYACLVMTRVISLPAAGKLCIDLGYKSLASENELQNRVGFLGHPQLKPSGHSEEHMVLETDENHGFKIGDVLYAVPIHICPTVALFERALVVENGSVSDSWRVAARDRIVNY
jgi:D-serine deaminase-like pyridoxal phosphate-dependent protein